MAKKPTQPEPSLLPHPKAQMALFGHETLEQHLLHLWNLDKLPQALLLSGPMGVGKATLAYRLARFLFKYGRNQPEESGGLFGAPLPKKLPQSLFVDEEDPVQRRIISGGHGDLLVLERAVDAKTGKLRSEILVDDVREVSGFFRLTAGEGGWRIAIIDSGDEMNRNAANALLKILEEPPPQSLLVITAHQPGRLLPTIRSRCRKLELKPLAHDQVANVVRRLLPEMPDSDLVSYCQMAEGSPGRALRLAMVDGLGQYRDLCTILGKLPKVDMIQGHELGNRLVGSSEESEGRWELFQDLMKLWCLRLLKSLATGILPEQPFSIEETRTFENIAQLGHGLEPWLALWDKMAQLMDRADAVNLDRKQVALSLLSAANAAAKGQF